MTGGALSLWRVDRGIPHAILVPEPELPSTTSSTKQNWNRRLDPQTMHQGTSSREHRRWRNQRRPRSSCRKLQILATTPESASPRRRGVSTKTNSCWAPPERPAQLDAILLAEPPPTATNLAIRSSPAALYSPPPPPPPRTKSRTAETLTT